MRIGANLVRGGFRAVKWMAVVGALAALGGAQAAAQPRVTKITFAGNLATFTLSEPATFMPPPTGSRPNQFRPSDTQGNAQTGTVFYRDQGVQTTTLRVEFTRPFNLANPGTISYTASEDWCAGPRTICTGPSANQRVQTFTNMPMTPDPAALRRLASLKVEAADGTGKVGEGVTTVLTATLDQALPQELNRGRVQVVVALREAGTQVLRSPGATGKAEAEDVTLTSDFSTTNVKLNPAGSYNGTPDVNAIIEIGPGKQSGSTRLILNTDGDAVDEKFLIVGQLREGEQRWVNIDTTHKPVEITIDDAEEQLYRYDNASRSLPTRVEGVTMGGRFELRPILPPNEALPPVFVRISDARIGFRHQGGQGGLPADVWTTAGVSFGGGGTYTGLPYTPNQVGNHVDAQAASLLITGPANDGNRTDDEVLVEFVQGSLLSNEVLDTLNNCSAGVEFAIGPCRIMILDRHKLPTVITGEAKDKASGGKTVTAVKEGGKAYVDVSYVNQSGYSVALGGVVGGDRISDTETFKITATVADAQAADVILTGGPFSKKGAHADKVAAGQLTLEARNDEDVGPEKLTINFKIEGETANGPGMETGTFEIDIVDATAKQVWPKAEAALRAAVDRAMPMSFNPGKCFDLMAGDLFEVADGFTATYAAESSSSAVSVEVMAGGTIQVCAVSTGMGAVRVTATTESSSVAASQTVSNVAEVSFDVEVVLETLTVTVAADPKTIMEGGSTMITATANRAVTEDTRVALSVVGDADAFEAPDGITIANGMKSGSAELTAREDADAMDETLTVVATGPGISGSQRFAIEVTDNDEPTRTIRAKGDAAALISAAVDKARGAADWMVGGMAASIDMSTLFEVDAGGRAAYSGMSSDEDVVRAVNAGHMLTLTPMGAGAATITVTGTDAASGDVATAMAEVVVALQTLVVTVAADAATVTEGASVTLTATANRPVTADTVLTLTVTGTTAAMAAVSLPDKLTIAAGAATGTATLTAVEDDDVADATVNVVANGPGIAVPISIPIAVEDDDRTVNAKSQAEVDALFVTATARAGGAAGWREGDADATVDMSALFTTIGSPTVSYTAESSDAATVAASASGTTLTLKPMQEGAAAITVTATDTSGDAADTATVMSEVAVGLLPLEIALMPASVEVAEGGEGVTITATANQMMEANTEVMLLRDAASAAGADDYTLSPSLITIMAGDNSGSLTLTAVDDRDVEGVEMLTLHGRAGDVDAGAVAVTIADNDVAVRYELSAAETNIAEGRSVPLTATACAAEPAGSCLETAVQADTEVQILRDGLSTAAAADYEAGPIMIKAGETSGAGLVTAVEDGEPDSGSGSPEVLILYGMADGVQTNPVSFNLWDAAVPALPFAAQLVLAALLAAGGCRRWRRR